MPGSGKKSNDDPAASAAQTALVPHPEFVHPSRDARQARGLREDSRGGTKVDAASRDLELEAVWLRLGSHWSSVVILPCEPDLSTAQIGRALSDAGSRLSIYPVEFIDAGALDLETSSQLIARMRTSAEAEESGAAGPPSFTSSSWSRPITRTVVAAPSPLANTLSIAVAHASDGVVLCVRRGGDRLAAVRETIDVLGTQMVLCCVLLE